MQDASLLRPILGKVELGPGNGEEGGLDGFEEDGAYGLGAVDGAVEVPPAEVEFRGNLVYLDIGQGSVLVGVM